VHGNGPAAARSALVVSGWSDDVVLLTDGPADLTAERPMLEAAGVRIREERVTGLAGRNGQLQRVEFGSGPAEERDALFVRTHRRQPNDLARSLACRLGSGGTIETDIDGRTGIPGVYAAGDAATDHGRSVANAIGTGSRVAQAVALDVMTQVTAARAMQAA
jgi:thioredoxin reductase